MINYIMRGDGIWNADTGERIEMTEHTAGPWRWFPDGDGNPEWHIQQETNPFRYVAINIPTEQDARLIAAAPEYDALLELALKYLEHPDVQAIPFALPVDNVVRMIESYIADNLT